MSGSKKTTKPESTEETAEELENLINEKEVVETAKQFSAEDLHKLSADTMKAMLEKDKDATYKLFDGVYVRGEIKASGIVRGMVKKDGESERMYVVEFADGSAAYAPEKELRKSSAAKYKFPGVEVLSDVVAYALVKGVTKTGKAFSKDTVEFTIETALATWFFRDYLRPLEIMELEPEESGREAPLFTFQDVAQAINDTLKVTVLDTIYRLGYAGGGTRFKEIFSRALRVAVSLYLANVGVRVGYADDNSAYLPLQNIKLKK